MQTPTRVRYIVLGFACALSMITYIDRVCFSLVLPYVQKEFELNDTRGAILGAAFALAYSLFEIPGGWMGDRYGAKPTLLRIVIGWSIFTALTGLIYPSYWGIGVAFWLLVFVRFCFGAGEAGAYPNLTKVTQNWFPFRERGFAQGAVWMSARFSGGITPLLVLFLFTSSHAATTELSIAKHAHLVVQTLGAYAAAPAAAPLGTFTDTTTAVHAALTKTTYWHQVFWIFGAMGLVWCIVFWWWYRERPEDKPTVNDAERELIRDGRQHAGDTHHNVPWRYLLTRPNLWVLCFLYAMLAYGWYFNFLWLPKLLTERYGVSQHTHGVWGFGLLLGAPFMAGCVGCLLGGYLTDLLIRKTGSRKWGRRLLGVVGYCIAAGCYLASIYAPTAGWFIFANSLVIFFADLGQASAWASCQDIGGKFSGIVSGCMNTLGNLGGMAAMLLTGIILDLVKGRGTPTLGWTINFMISAAVFLVGAFLWLQFDASKSVIPVEEKSS